VKIAPDEPKYFEDARRFLDNPTRKSMIVSVRWIDYCIKIKEVYVKFPRQVYRVLIPFAFPVPFKEFRDVTFCVSGFQPDEKEMLKLLGGYLGACYTTDM